MGRETGEESPVEYAGNRIQRVEQRVGKESVDYIYLTYISQKQDREIDLKSNKIISDIDELKKKTVFLTAKEENNGRNGIKKCL